MLIKAMAGARRLSQSLEPATLHNLVEQEGSHVALRHVATIQNCVEHKLSIALIVLSVRIVFNGRSW
jgi:hypothetical protein